MCNKGEINALIVRTGVLPSLDRRGVIIKQNKTIGQMFSNDASEDTSVKTCS